LGLRIPSFPAQLCHPTAGSGLLEEAPESFSNERLARGARPLPPRAKGENMVRSVIAGIALCAITSGSAFAQQLPKGVVIVTPDKAKWGNTSTPGAKAGVTQQSLLVGDPSKLGTYIYQNKFLPNNKVPPHSHPDSRTYTVLSGTWYVGFGDKFDESKLIALPAGSFYAEPAGVPHFVATKKDGAQVQTSGTGPTRLNYVNPADAQ